MAELNIQLKAKNNDQLFPRTKAEVVEGLTAAITAQIATAGTLKRQVVSELPASNIDPNTIYMVQKIDGGGAQNIYTEYMYIENAWEIIGDTAVDISGKADKATTLAGYGITDAYTKNEVDSALSSVAGDITYEVIEG